MEFAKPARWRERPHPLETSCPEPLQRQGNGAEGDDLSIRDYRTGYSPVSLVTHQIATSANDFNAGYRGESADES